MNVYSNFLITLEGRGKALKSVASVPARIYKREADVQQRQRPGTANKKSIFMFISSRIKRMQHDARYLYELCGVDSAGNAYVNSYAAGALWKHRSSQKKYSYTFVGPVAKHYLRESKVLLQGLLHSQAKQENGKMTKLKYRHRR